MFKKTLMSLVLALTVTVLIPSTSFAIFPDAKISNTTWLKKFQAKAPTALCHDLGKSKKTSALMAAKNITYDQCLPLITKSIDKCTAIYSSKLPASMSRSDAKSWGKEVAKCAGGDFYVNHLLGG